MGVILTADVFCDHKNCAQHTTSDDVALHSYTFYGQPGIDYEVNSFHEDGWTKKCDEGSRVTLYFCPKHSK